MYSNGGLWSDLFPEHINKPSISLLFQSVTWAGGINKVIMLMIIKRSFAYETAQESEEQMTP